MLKMWLRIRQPEGLRTNFPRGGFCQTPVSATGPVLIPDTLPEGLIKYIYATFPKSKFRYVLTKFELKHWKYVCTFSLSHSKLGQIQILGLSVVGIWPGWSAVLPWWLFSHIYGARQPSWKFLCTWHRLSGLVKQPDYYHPTNPCLRCHHPHYSNINHSKEVINSSVVAVADLDQQYIYWNSNCLISCKNISSNPYLSVIISPSSGISGCKAGDYSGRISGRLILPPPFPGIAQPFLPHSFAFCAKICFFLGLICW